VDPACIIAAAMRPVFRVRRSPARLLLALTAILAAGVAAAADAPAPAKHVDLAIVDNAIITPAIEDYLAGAMERAQADGAACLIIQLDTPGGLLESTRLIVKRMLNSRLPVVAYVAPSGSRAASAGTFITMAANVAAMAPSTHIGAAHPVMAGGIWPATPGAPQPSIADRPTSASAAAAGDSPMNDKIMNDTLAWAADIASQRGRNVAWARKAVSESVSIGAQEALDLHVVDLIAADLPELLAKLDGREVELAGGAKASLQTAGAAVVALPMSGRLRFLAIIANPDVAYLLMMLGIFGLIFEFTHPGIGFPGIGGLVCLLLALYSFQALPVNYAGVALVALGVVLLGVETQVMAHGLFGLGGIACFFLGGLMLFDSSEPALRVSPGVLLPMSLTLGLILLFILRRAATSLRVPVTTGSSGMIGLTGKALSELAPAGSVFVHGEIWSAVSAAAIAAGEPIRVLGIDGLTLRVERAAPPSEEANPTRQGAQ
jgi:membrane-bound serine protease (ClpP class)